MENNTATQTKTLRSAARELVSESATEAAKLGHEQNFHKLHVRRDGTISWTESINRSDDIIDGLAEGFAAVSSVACVGTGGYVCNCEHCSEVYDANDEQAAKDAGREYDADSKYETRADAIADAVSESDLTEIQADLLAKFDEIPAGYFDDEPGVISCDDCGRPAVRVHRVAVETRGDAPESEYDDYAYCAAHDPGDEGDIEFWDIMHSFI